MKIDFRKNMPFLVFILLSMIWSSTWLAIKIGLQSLPPFLSAGLRFLLAFFALLIFMFIKKLKFPAKLSDHLFFLAFGLVMFTGGYAFVYWGQQYIASGMASVLFSVMPFYVLIFGIWLLPAEKITLVKFTGVLIGFIGVILIFWEQINFDYADPMQLAGMGAVLAGPMFSALGTIMGKRASRKYNPIVLNVLPLFYASISFLILSWQLESQRTIVFDQAAVFSIIYLAVFGTATAFVLYFWLLGHRSVILTSMITFVTPPLALIIGWIVLSEPITLFLVCGLLLILAGIFIVRR